jgi:hypothetical protein
MNETRITKNKPMTLITSESIDLKPKPENKCINKNQILKLFGTLCFMICEMSICTSLVFDARGL